MTDIIILTLLILLIIFMVSYAFYILYETINWYVSFRRNYNLFNEYIVELKEIKVGDVFKEKYSTDTITVSNVSELFKYRIISYFKNGQEYELSAVDFYQKYYINK